MDPIMVLIAALLVAKTVALMIVAWALVRRWELEELRRRRVELLLQEIRG